LSSGRRFHPKVFNLLSSEDDHAHVVIVGSANLTGTALHANAEGVAVLEHETQDERDAFERQWRSLWALGHVPDEEEIQEYEARYRRWRQTRRAAGMMDTRVTLRGQEEILRQDDADIDPSQASVCWIECGYITAQGRELELKAEQSLFFGL